MSTPRRRPVRRARTSARRGAPGARTGRHAPRPGGSASRRPAQRRPARRRASAATTRRAPGGLTGRAAVLGLVVCALVLSLAYPVKQYLAQRSTIAQLERQNVEVHARVTALEQRQRQLSDPDYIRRLARERLQYVMPGDVVYRVVTPDPPGHHPRRPAPTHALDSHKPWYSQLWDTVQVADGG